AGLLAGLLYDRLGLLARRSDRGLEDELQLLAVLGADAVGSALPAGLLQQPVGLIDVELPFRVLRAKTLRIVEEISDRDRGAPVVGSFDRSASDEQAERLPDGRIAEQRMLSFGVRAFAVDLRPRIGAVELDVLHRPAPHDLGASLGVAGVFELEEDFVLDL